MVLRFSGFTEPAALEIRLQCELCSLGCDVQEEESMAQE